MQWYVDGRCRSSRAKLNMALDDGFSSWSPGVGSLSYFLFSVSCCRNCSSRISPEFRQTFTIISSQLIRIRRSSPEFHQSFTRASPELTESSNITERSGAEPTASRTCQMLRMMYVCVCIYTHTFVYIYIYICIYTLYIHIYLQYWTDSCCNAAVMSYLNVADLLRYWTDWAPWILLIYFNIELTNHTDCFLYWYRPTLVMSCYCVVVAVLISISKSILVTF